MLQRPRPWVAATSVLPSGVSERSLTETLGRLLPTRDQLPPWAAEEKTPTSVATASLPPAKTTSLTGASTRLPEMSVHEAPPFDDSKTWPTPGSSGEATQRRE